MDRLSCEELVDRDLARRLIDSPFEAMPSSKMRTHSSRSAAIARVVVPITSWGRSVTEAMALMLNCEVFLARTVSGRVPAASRLNTSCFMTMTSGTSLPPTSAA